MRAKRLVIGVLLAGSALGFGLAGYHRWLERTEPGTDPESEQAGRAELPRGDGFPFPDDRGGRLLKQVLSPSEQPAPARRAGSAGPRPLSDPNRPPPELPLPLLQPEMPPLPAGPTARPPRLWLLPEDPPFARSAFDPVIPQELYLPAGRGVRLPSPNVEQMLPLPILAQPALSRSALDDPTAELSAAAALAAPLPPRTHPAPFLRLSLPDPFELRQAGPLAMLAIDHVPAGTVPLPGR